MSLTNAVMEILNKHLSSFFEVIIEKYSMNTTPEELFSLLENGESIAKPKVKKEKEVKKEVKESNSQPEPLTKAKIAKCSVAELKLLCKERSLKLSGKKEELVSRLLETLENGNNSDEKKTTTKSKVKNEKVVIKKIQEAQVMTSIRRNKFNNFEHPTTRLVFREETKKAYGKQADDGEVLGLTDDDIELCKQYKFEYELPENLDGNDTDINKVKVKELEDDDDEIIVEQEESDVEEDVVDEEESEVEIEDD